MNKIDYTTSALLLWIMTICELAQVSGPLGGEGVPLKH